MKRILFPILTILVSLLWPASSKAQTVESVLRAIQERSVVLARRGDYGPPIVWPHELPPFPADETIDQLPVAIAALNVASQEYDRVKWQYLPYDSAADRLITGASTIWDMQEYDATKHYFHWSDGLTSIRLPSVGRFDESNWRQKLILLASNIDHLRVLAWPVSKQWMGRGSGGWGPILLGPSHNEPYDYFNLDLIFNFPSHGGSFAFSNGGVGTFQSGSGGGAFNVLEWRSQDSAFAGEKSDGKWDNYFSFNDSFGCIYGLKAKSDVTTASSSALNLPARTGIFSLFKRLQIILSQEDIGQTLSGISTQGLPLNHYSFVSHGTSQDGGVTTWGGWENDFEEVNLVDGVDDSEEIDATFSTGYQAATGMLGIGISFSGELELAPEPYVSRQMSVEEYPDLPYVLKLKAGSIELPSAIRESGTIGYYQGESRLLDLNALVLFRPNFTSFLPSSTKKVPLIPNRAGEVDVTAANRDLLKIDLGRGIYDVNQTAWLGIRSDGFGSLTFNGSPDEFEVLYQNDPTKYGTGSGGGDNPVGGVSLYKDEQTPPTNLGASGWNSRFDYVAGWLDPRLKQVKSGDVLVNITFLSNYNRKIDFYWVKNLGGKTNGFYSLPGSPFKQIIVRNPTAPADAPGFPTEREHLQVIENGKRFWDIRHSGEAWDVSNPEIFTFKRGSASDGEIGAVEWLQKIEVPYNTEEDGGASYVVEGPWTIKETSDQQTVTTVADFDSSPLYAWDQVRLSSLSVTAGSAVRHTDFDWVRDEEVGDVLWPSIYRLTGAHFLGDANWTENGKEQSYDADGMLESESFVWGGSDVEVSHGWNGNSRNSTWKLNTQSFLDETAVYSNHLHHIAISRGGEPAVELDYASADGSSGVPWSLALANYTGGYQEAFSSSYTDGETTTVAQEGWGSALASGTTTTTKTNRSGGLVSQKVQTSGGTTIRLDTGLEHTDWGAPTKISHLRGDPDLLSYETTGLNWGALVSRKSPSNVTTSVPGYDSRGRPTGFSNGFESFTANYTNPTLTRWTGIGQREVSVGTSAFGEFRSYSSNLAGTSSVDFNPGGTSTLTVDGHAQTQTIDTTGVLHDVGNGLGSRGAGITYGVESGQLFQEATQKKANGSDSTLKVRTTFDSQGRVVKVKRPAENGTIITEEWAYDDANRKVTHTPGVGPLAQVTETTLSPDGSTRTVKVGGNYNSRTTLIDSGLGRTIEVMDDSLETPAWSEISRTSVDRATGTTTYIPRDLAANVVTVTQSAPGANQHQTISVGRTGDTLTIDQSGGLVTSLTGYIQGVGVNFSNITYSAQGQLEEASGTLAGMSAGFSVDDRGRLTNVHGAGLNQNMEYPNTGGGYQTKITDQLRGNSTTVVSSNAVGDPVSVTKDGVELFSFNTADTNTGRTTSINGSVTLSSNHYGSVTQKTYSDPANPEDPALLTEVTPLNSDGSSQGTSASGPTGGISASITTQTPTQQVIDYGDGYTVNESYYMVGPRSGVSAPGDTRTFTYSHGQLRTETHTNGPWSGWTVEWVPDSHGRVETLRVGSRDFGLGYFNGDRIGSSTSTQLAASYTPDTQTGRPATLTRQLAAQGQQSFLSTWSYDGDRLQGLTTHHTGTPDFTYSYTPDENLRIKGRTASSGVSWSDLSYTGKGELKGGTMTGNRALHYAYVNGTRSGGQATGSQSDADSYTANPLNQVTDRTVTSRGFGIYGTVNPAAQVKVFHPFGAGSGLPMPVDATTGAYGSSWTVPQEFNSGATIAFEALVRGTVPGAHPAIAERKIPFIIPPVHEVLSYDGAGRLKGDALWSYTWDGVSRLRSMVRKAGTFTPGQTAESLTFIYDADGRRISKAHSATTGSGATAITHMENSNILWAGWLPVLEQRWRDGRYQGQRWFQWGADLSGTLDGAGGIGGLLAIIEENANGTLTRILLPVQDGLGNITAVLNAATGQVVAQYDYGPFGEPLGEQGEPDACPFRWQTKWYDRECQHYYYGYRHYDPKLGRWLSRDPLGEEGGFNLYSYCGNDPVNKHDPTGLSKYDDEAEKKFAKLLLLSDAVRRAAAKWNLHESFGPVDPFYAGASSVVEKWENYLGQTGLPLGSTESAVLVDAFAEIIAERDAGNRANGADNSAYYNSPSVKRSEIYMGSWYAGLEMSGINSFSQAVAHWDLVAGDWDYAPGLATLNLGMMFVPELRAEGALMRLEGGVLRAGHVEASIAAKTHGIWAQNLVRINRSVVGLAKRALRNNPKNWRAAEAALESYLESVEGRLVRMNSRFRVELQPAAVPGRGRVYSFVDRSDLGILSEIPYPQSRRLDAGIIDITGQASADGLYPVVSGFDITVDPLKPNIVPYYQEAFGSIPIFDIRPVR